MIDPVVIGWIGVALGLLGLVIAHVMYALDRRDLRRELDRLAEEDRARDARYCAQCDLDERGLAYDDPPPSFRRGTKEA